MSFSIYFLYSLKMIHIMGKNKQKIYLYFLYHKLPFDSPHTHIHTDSQSKAHNLLPLYAPIFYSPYITFLLLSPTISFYFSLHAPNIIFLLFTNNNHFPHRGYRHFLFLPHHFPSSSPNPDQ